MIIINYYYDCVIIKICLRYNKKQVINRKTQAKTPLRDVLHIITIHMMIAVRARIN
jgi:hypothetical protein